MADDLVLSLFPGIGMLDRGFEEEGYYVVRGPDVLWGGDIRSFHPPAGVFEGVIGGPPCQAFSSLANLVRAKGHEPKWGNLIPEFSRCCAEAEPLWFLMENVPKAPEPDVPGYDVASFLIDNCWLGEAQMRKRRFSFGCRGGAPNLRRWIPGVALELPEQVVAVGGDHGIPLHGCKRKAVTHRPEAVPVRSPLRRTLAEMLELQGFPPDWLDHQPWTMQAKRKMVGNGVPLPMARVVAQAVRRAMALNPEGHDVP